MTLRRRIIELLEDKELGVRELSRALSVREKEIYGHLDHVSRTLLPKRRLLVHPSTCLRCGFRFSKRVRWKKPGRCPVCKGEKISEPVFFIR